MEDLLKMIYRDEKNILEVEDKRIKEVYKMFTKQKKTKDDI